MTDGSKSLFIPNSFTYPNAYVDRLLAYLTGEETKVLLYAARRIFGFNQREDRIAVSQFCNGITNKEGKVLDEGTGLSRPTVMKALACLVQFRIVLRLEDNDPHKNEGPLYALQLESDLVDWRALRERRETWEAMQQRKNAAIRQGVLAKHTPIYGGGENEGSISDPPGSQPTPLVGIDGVGSQLGTVVGSQPGGGSGLPLTHNISEKNSRKTVSGKAARDSRLDHPAIKLVRETLRQYPNKATWDTIIQQLGDTPDAEKFKAVFTAWTLAGNKPTNLSGLLDWYRNGIPARKNGKIAPPGTVQETILPDGTRADW